MRKALIILTLCLLANLAATAQQADNDTLSSEIVRQAEKLIDLDFTDTERDSLLSDLESNLKSYQAMHGLSIPNAILPAIQFDPRPPGFVVDCDQRVNDYSQSKGLKRPDKLEELAFWSVRDLAELISTRQVTSLELTRLCLDRLKKHDSVLHCVITLTEDLAVHQARQADQEIAAGNYRGMLHGIPYGTKDLLAAKGYPTTWGAAPYRNQVLDYDATVTAKLREAGAVLVAKLSLGALAWGDVWYDDTTRNPWNPEQGSSGSSAGPASAVAAGLVPFAIGSETWGSIVSPSTRCGTTGLRPTFGRVSRYGAMALSWSMDKLGPICRTVEDCAIVFDAIQGSDGLDPTVIPAAFNYIAEIDLTGLKVGYLKTDFDNDSSWMAYNLATLKVLGEMGVRLVPIELPSLPTNALPIILSAEAAAAFDELTRTNQDDLMVRQIKDAWPNVFRSSRFIPAVEYIQANRIRTMLIAEMDRILSEIDLWVSPTFEGDNLLLTNLTGHPCVVLPNGFRDDKTPVSITFLGKLFDEGRLLAFARAYQDQTGFHKKHPPAFQ